MTMITGVKSKGFSGSSALQNAPNVQFGHNAATPKTAVKFASEATAKLPYWTQIGRGVRNLLVKAPGTAMTAGGAGLLGAGLASTASTGLVTAGAILIPVGIVASFLLAPFKRH